MSNALRTGAAVALLLAAACAPQAPAPGAAGAVAAEVSQNAAQPRRGLFGGLFAPRAGTPAVDVGPDGLLDFAVVAKVCGVPTSRLGTAIDRSDAGYRLYDTNPATTRPRTHYVTGFRDRCARRFTAALALFGSPAMHEATRYNPLNGSPYSATDKAYEQVKARVCRVPSGQPCPANRMSRLQSDTAFVSVYRSFGNSGVWLELFLHKGQLVSQGLEGG